MELTTTARPGFEVTVAGNVTRNLTYCETQPQNPYCGVFGVGEIIEVIVLLICSLIGTFGNLMVIFSIILEKRVHKSGNMFIINLAIADLIVCGFFLPTVIANVILTENALPMKACQFAGYLVTVTCACSVCNLAFIAANRYWAVVRNSSYTKVFSNRNVYFMVAFTWLWSNLIVTPTLYGWSSLVYDYKMAECGWDDKASIAYNIVLIVCAIFIPVCVIVFCYWQLYKNVKERGDWFRKQGAPSVDSSNSSQQRLQLKREINLLKTLATTVVFFILCWTPYGFVVLFFSKTVPPHAKKTVARFGLCNSAINFIVYGVMNPMFRKGYNNLIIYICCCKETCKRLLGEDNKVDKPHNESINGRLSAGNRVNVIMDETKTNTTNVSPLLTPKMKRTDANVSSPV